jgi:SAM-dependent methyltransferase
MRAFIVLYRAFRSFPPKARAHTLIRFLTCPLLRVAERVPRGATLLDIGAGHGVFAVLLRDRVSRVVAVEPDLRKVLERGRLARSGRASRPFADSRSPAETRSPAKTRSPAETAADCGRDGRAPIHFVIGYDDVIRGSFDAISIIDVLYKIPASEWDPLLDRIAARLNPGGTLIIKEMDPTERMKNAWNRLQERAASALGLTLGESFSYESPADFTARLQRHGFASVDVQRIDTWYPHPHLLYVARLDMIRSLIKNEV